MAFQRISLAFPAPDSNPEWESGSEPTSSASDLEEVLGAMGLAGIDRRDQVEALVASFTSDRHLDVGLDSLRYGVLTLAGDPVSAHLLRCAGDQLLALLERDIPGAVTELRIRVRTASQH